MITFRRARRTVRIAATFFAALIVGILITTASVSAASFVYKGTLTRLSANTAYGNGPNTMYGNRINGCESPTWSNSIYLKSSTGAVSKLKSSSNCVTVSNELFHEEVANRNAWCANNSSTAKYGVCTKFYV